MLLFLDMLLLMCLHIAGAAVSGHAAADCPWTLCCCGVWTPAADDLSQYDYTALAVYHPSAHTYTSHTCPNAVFDPMSASFYRNHCKVSGSIRAARSEYIPAVYSR